MKGGRGGGEISILGRCIAVGGYKWRVHRVLSSQNFRVQRNAKKVGAYALMALVRIDKKEKKLEGGGRDLHLE